MADVGFPAFRFSLTDTPTVVWNILLFCDPTSIVSFMRMSKRALLISQMDGAWRELLLRWHFSQLMPLQGVGGTPYQQFTAYIASLQLFEGVYTFAAEDELDAMFSIAGATMVLSQATLGFRTPLLRVRLEIRFTSGQTETLDGTMRFSYERNMFHIATTPSGNVRTAGPRFNCVVATSQRPYANQSKKHFAEHRGGLRMVLTVAKTQQTIEKRNPSSVSVEDIIAVTRKPSNPIVTTPRTPPSSARLTRSPGGSQLH